MDGNYQPTPCSGRKSQLPDILLSEMRQYVERDIVLNETPSVLFEAVFL
jgi:hypothetical protein